MRALRLTAALAALSCPLAAQAASSSTFFVSAVEQASGAGVTDTLLYSLIGTQGSGVVPDPLTASETYVIEGGFPAAFDASVVGVPWAAGILPRWVGPTGMPVVTIHGTELDLGSNPTVTIGGVSAPLAGPRATDRTFYKVPDQPVPGYQPVVLTNELGSTLVPGGVGVLPLLELVCPAIPEESFGLRYRGKQDDNAVLLIGTGMGTPFALPPYRYSLQLDPMGMTVSSAFTVTNPDGSLLFVIPPTPLVDVVILQGFTFMSTHAGYAPGSFTNVLPL